MTWENVEGFHANASSVNMKKWKLKKQFEEKRNQSGWWENRVWWVFKLQKGSLKSDISTFVRNKKLTFSCKVSIYDNNKLSKDNFSVDIIHERPQNTFFHKTLRICLMIFSHSKFWLLKVFPLDISGPEVFWISSALRDISFTESNVWVSWENFIEMSSRIVWTWTNSRYFSFSDIDECSCYLLSNY